MFAKFIRAFIFPLIVVHEFQMTDNIFLPGVVDKEEKVYNKSLLSDTWV